MSGPGATSGPFGELHHIGIAIPSIEGVTERLCELLAGEIVEEGIDEELYVAWAWIASPGNPIIETLAPTRDSGPVARDLARRGSGLHHLSFRPKAIDDALAHVHVCSFNVIGESHNHSGHEEFFIDPRETGGALFHSFIAIGNADKDL